MDLSGYSDEQLKQIAGINSAPAQDLSKYSDEDLAKIAGIPSKPSFIDRIGADLTNRANEGADAIVAYKAGDQGLAQTGLQLAGKMGAGAANDIAGEIVNSATPDIVKQGLATGAQKTANAIDNTSIGQKIGDLLLNAKDAYGNFANNNPNAARSLESAANIATALPLAKTVETTAQGVSNIGSGLKKVADFSAINDIGRNLPGILGDTRSGSIKPAPITPDALQAGATMRYNNAAQMGGVIKPEGFDTVINSIKQKVGYQTPEGIAFAGETPVTDTINRLDSLKGQPISLAGLDEIDGRLRSDISKAIRAGDNESASKLMEIKSTLKNASNTVKPEDLVNPQAFNEWRQGDALWTAKSKMQQLQDVIDNAYNTDNPDTAMRTGYKNLARQLKKNSMGWTPQEINLIDQAAKRSLTGDALKAVGGRLMSHMTALALGGAGGALGGIPGAVAGFAAGEAAGFPLRSLGNALQEGRATAPMKAVAGRSSVAAALPQDIKDIMQLPPAQAKAALQNLRMQQLQQAIPLKK